MQEVINTFFFLPSLLVSPLASDGGGEGNVTAIMFLLNYSNPSRWKLMAAVLRAPSVLSGASCCSHFPTEPSSGKHKITGESLI